METKRAMRRQTGNMRNAEKGKGFLLTRRKRERPSCQLSVFDLMGVAPPLPWVVHMRELSVVTGQALDADLSG
jgi:hypothetical protein